MEYRKIIDVEFREFDRRTLEKTWEWLNDPEIKDLTSTPDFDRESQEAWFQRLKGRDDYYIRSIWRDDEPIGVLGIKHLTPTDGEIWGYIGEKKYWGKAIGVEMMQHLLDYGKSQNLESIYAVILKRNVNSYKLHRRFGFEKEKDMEGERVMMRYYL